MVSLIALIYVMIILDRGEERYLLQKIEKAFVPDPANLTNNVENFLNEVTDGITTAMEQASSVENYSDVEVEVNINREFDILEVVENPIKSEFPCAVGDLGKMIRVVAEEATMFNMRPDIIMGIVYQKEFEEQQ